MIPRGAPDIGWSDLAAGLAFCLSPTGVSGVRKRLERKWSPGGDALACLSVRSGFDLALQALALPAGSEVLVSAVTIPDMARLLRRHQLATVPVDVDPHTLSVSAADLERGITPRTRAVLAAHLFGARMPMEPILEIARAHSLFVFEDCAQAFDHSGYRGHPNSDVSMFSFGPIKTATALGGGLLRFRDPTLLAQVRTLQAGYPLQPQSEHRRRLVRFALLRLAARPWLFKWIVRWYRARGKDHDEALSGAVRAFAGAPLLPRLRRQPCAALLRLLLRRVEQNRSSQIAHRIGYARRLAAALPGVSRPGAGAIEHSHWMTPVESRDSHGLVRRLRDQGFDATCRGSSLEVVTAPAGWPDRVRARQMLARIVYLPAWPWMTEQDVERLGRLVVEFERDR
ncbi:MAG: DegT/DnrJ/EryC1/StrS family aminotransferase [Actinomycetota bacterium]